MVCKSCGNNLESYIDVCPFCGTDNAPTRGGFWDTVFSPLPQQKGIDRSSKIMSDDWEHFDNCSDREYDDDEDYDDFDN